MQNEQQNLEHQLALDAFRDFTCGRIAPHQLERDGQRFTHTTVQLVFEAFCTGRARTIGQQLYAGIKTSSKYFSQVKLGKELGWPYPFPVRLEPDKEGYVVKGGIGGQYRLDDVELYVIEDGEAKAVLL